MSRSPIKTWIANGAIALAACLAVSCSKPAPVASTPPPAAHAGPPGSAGSPLGGPRNNPSPGQRPTLRTGVDTFTPLAAGRFDPSKAEVSISRQSSPYDESKDGPLKPGERLVEGSDGQQMIERIVQTQLPPAVYVSNVSLRPLVVSPNENWLVGQVTISNDTKAMSVTDVQISFVSNGARTVILGGKGVDGTNPLKSKSIPPKGSETFQVSAPVKYATVQGSGGSFSLEAEMVIDGPPGLVKAEKVLDPGLFNPAGNRPATRGDQ